jgi:putative ABC transport system permease protein
MNMLFNDRAKLIGLVLGIAVASLLIAQQSSMFLGLMRRSQNVIAEARGADVWVMHALTEQFDLPQPMRSADLYRVRGIGGVAVAAPLFKAALPVRTSDGRLSNALLLGLDEATFTGATDRFLMGTPQSLRVPDAIAVDRVGFAQFWPGEPLALGKVLELNDRRAVVTAITDPLPAFSAQAIIYTRFRQAVGYAPAGRNDLSFILVETKPGHSADNVALRITQATGLAAYASPEFAKRTMRYNLRKTGIVVNFATTILLGLIVGCSVTGLIFSNFVTDNLKQFATLKIVGFRDRWLATLVVYQAAVVVAMGASLGIALAAAFFRFVCTPTSALRGFVLPGWIVVATIVLIACSVMVATFVSVRRVVKVEPATVLRSLV